MATLWIIFIALHVVSFGFCIFTINRLYGYIVRYRFDESKYTLLFGFIHLRWIAAAYIIISIMWIGGSYTLFTHFNYF